jgi:hypothetical protein
MLETALLAAIAWLLLAAASFRFRREAGVPNPRQVRALRLAAAALLALALFRCGTPLTGERWIRALGGASIGAVLVVLALSADAMFVLRPLRQLLTRPAPALLRRLRRPVRQPRSY